MASGIMALFGLHNARTHNTVKTFTDAFHMPYVTPSASLNSTEQDKGFMLYMRPFYTKAVLDVIHHYSWEKIYYFYQNDDGKDNYVNYYLIYSYAHNFQNSKKIDACPKRIISNAF